MKPISADLEKLLDLYEKASDVARLGVWEMDLIQNRLFWSPVIKQIHGVAEDFEPDIATAISFIREGESKQQMLMHFKEAELYGTPYDMELQLVTATGNNIWVKATGRSEFSEGKCIRLYGTFQDIENEKAQGKKLLDSEIKYRSIIENSLYGVLLTIPGKFVLQANQAALKMFGYTIEEFRKLDRCKVLDCSHPNLPGFLAKRESEGKATADMIALRKDGTRFSCELSTATFTDSEGRKLSSLVIIDVSARKAAEEKIRLSEAQFREAFEHSAIGVALFDLNGKWIRVNQGLCNMLGYSEEELVNSRFQDLTHPDDLMCNQQILKNLIEGISDNDQQEKRYIHKNGQVVWVLMGISILRDANNNPLHCISQIQDITKTKEVERALSLSEEKYRKIFENIQDIYYCTDHNGIVTEISPSIEKYYNFERKNIIGNSVNDFYYYEEDHNKIMSALQTDLSVIDFEVKLKSKNNDLLYASVNARLLVENGTIIGTEGSIRDISLRKLQENELKTLNKELKALNTHKEKLLSVIGHDLKNPIASALKLAELALMDSADTKKEELIEYLHKMHSGLDNAYELLEDLLNWAKSQFNSIHFNPVYIKDLTGVLEQVIKRAGPAAEIKGIQLSVSASPHISLMADKDMLETIIRNLISNAIKFTNDGGTINLSASVRSNKVKFVVTDTGSGISPQIVRQLFDKGFSHTTYGTAGEKGTGLGLDLCREFVEKHKGKIWVESKEGEGSTFYFTIPLRQY